MSSSILFKYGVNGNDEVIHIDQATRGQTNLHCPYCGSALIVRKGDSVAHHYAHNGHPCNQSQLSIEAIRLPWYDQFDLGITPRTRALLDEFKTGRRMNDKEISSLRQQGLIAFVPWRVWRPWQLSDKGKVCYGELSLIQFHAFQALHFQSRHDELAARSRNDHEQATNLRLYRAQMRRLLNARLYFMQVGPHLHKIGITTRPVLARLAEIQRDVRLHLGETQVTVVGTWATRGTLELYFKHRHARYNQPLGTLTEYFRFPDPDAILAELEELNDLSPSRLEKDILADRAVAMA